MDCHEYTLDIDDICLHSEQCEAKPSTQIQYELTLDGIVVGKGTLGFRGNGIKNVSYIPSTEDEGENVVTVLTDNGQTFTFNVRNGSRGNGISSIDMEQSDVDAGASKLTVNFTDGDSKEFLVYNGHTGQAAGFGKPTVSIEGGYGTPSATVEASGPDTAKVFSFKLSNLKGNGIEFADYIQSTQDDGSNRLTFTFSDGTTKEVAIKNGSKGSKGVGVSSVEQTVTSTEDGGENSIVVKLDNGEEFPFAVRNGRKGSTGSAAGFGAPTATVDDNEGTPSVTVAATGPDTAKVFSFEFKNLKGHTPTQAEMDALVDANGTVVGTKTDLNSHIASKANPHGVTKTQVGLGNVDNTSDLDKPVSTATQTALDGKANSSTTLAGYGIGDAYTKTAVDNLLSGYLKMPIQDNAGFHNSLYRGKDITSYWTDGSLWDRIQGTNGRKLFEDLYVGDWFSTGTHSINGTSANQCFMIGGFDIRRGVGANNVAKHHIVPVACNATGTDTRALFSSQMYATVPFIGAYQGSIVHPLFLPDGAVSTDLKAIFGSHLLQSSELISTANNSNGYGRYGGASGVSTSWTWVDVYGILMSEVEVYGSIVWSSSGYDGGISSRGQLPLFRLRPDLISSRSYDLWLRDATSGYNFALVNSYGDANHTTATYSLGIRPRFLIG